MNRTHKEMRYLFLLLLVVWLCGCAKYKTIDAVNGKYIVDNKNQILLFSGVDNSELGRAWQQGYDVGYSAGKAQNPIWVEKRDR